MDIIYRAGRLVFLLKKYLIFFLRPVFSFCFGRENCLCCGKQVFSSPICPSCQKKMLAFAQTEFMRCSCCGKLLVNKDPVCLQCREKNVLGDVDSCIPLFPYRMWNKDLLTQWKLSDQRALSYFYASLLYSQLEGKNAILVPVPPRKGKIRKRGWDQVDELCKILHFEYGITLFKALERRTAIQQKKLNREERLKNVGSGFEISRIFKKVREKGNLPREIYIIDDVITTGSTIETCASLLKSEGILKVHVLSLFKVD